MKTKRNVQRRLSPAPCSAEATAVRIAKEIMTVDLGAKSAVTVERIALMKKLPHGEDNLGGRNRESVEGVILDILKDVWPLPPIDRLEPPPTEKGKPL